MQIVSFVLIAGFFPAKTTTNSAIIIQFVPATTSTPPHNYFGDAYLRNSICRPHNIKAFVPPRTPAWLRMPPNPIAAVAPQNCPNEPITMNNSTMILHNLLPILQPNHKNFAIMKTAGNISFTRTTMPQFVSLKSWPLSLHQVPYANPGVLRHYDSGPWRRKAKDERVQAHTHEIWHRISQSFYRWSGQESDHRMRPSNPFTVRHIRTRWWSQLSDNLPEKFPFYSTLLLRRWIDVNY